MVGTGRYQASIGCTVLNGAAPVPQTVKILHPAPATAEWGGIQSVRFSAEGTETGNISVDPIVVRKFSMTMKQVMMLAAAVSGSILNGQWLCQAEQIDKDGQDDSETVVRSDRR